MNDDKRINVLLLKPHRHLGVSYIEGDVINVTVEQKDWLLSHGVAMVQPTETKQDKKS